ncbi:MAG: hypothetical protein ACLR4Z_03135 [Butyricicoccaceae bacterium]
MNGYMKPQDIEKRSFEIITPRLGDARVSGTASPRSSSASSTPRRDFDYADSLAFSPDVIEQG